MELAALGSAVTLLTLGHMFRGSWTLPGMPDGSSDGMPDGSYIAREAGAGTPSYYGAGRQVQSLSALGMSNPGSYGAMIEKSQLL